MEWKEYLNEDEASNQALSSHSPCTAYHIPLALSASLCGVCVRL